MNKNEKQKSEKNHRYESKNSYTRHMFPINNNQRKWKALYQFPTATQHPLTIWGKKSSRHDRLQERKDCQPNIDFFQRKGKAKEINRISQLDAYQRLILEN